MTDFSKTKRPPSDKFFNFHPDSLVLIRLIKGFQKDIRRALPPIGSPKYTNRIAPTLQLNIDAPLIATTMRHSLPPNGFSKNLLLSPIKLQKEEG